MNEDDLKSINGFDKYTKFIMQFIMQNTTLWKLIFYPYSMPLSDSRAVDPEDPYVIFSRQTDADGKIIDSHGVVLFDDKDDSIQNSNNVTVLVNYHSERQGNSYFCDSIFITFQIICKGEGVRKLANGLDRTQVIADLISNEFDKAKINNIGQVHKRAYDKINGVNEENTGHYIVFTDIGFSSNLKNNKNVQKRGTILC